MQDLERMSALEQHVKSIDAQLNELKTDVKDLSRLTTAVEKVATKIEDICKGMDKVDNRLSTLEQLPAKRYEKYKVTIITSAITLVIGALVSAVLALVIK